MTTKKLLIIVGSLLGAVVLLVAIFAGAIVGIAFYAIGQSEAAQTAKNFLKANEKLRADIGDVQDFGYFVTGSVKERNSDGNATLYLKVIGAKRTTNATVSLVSREGRQWRVTDAAYENEAGQTVELLEKYDEPGAQ